MADIKVKYFGEDPIALEEVTQGAWIDIPLQQNLNLLGYPTKKVPLGIAIQLPKDYEAHIVPKSSTFGKYGLIQTTGMSVVDSSYDDEWFWPCFLLLNHAEIRYIPRGVCIAQFRIVKKQPKINFK